jgi:biopolymer transport protein ExbB
MSKSKQVAAKPANNVSGQFSSIFAVVMIPVLLITAILIFQNVLGAGSNFEGGDNKNHPIPGNFLGMMYKGGFLVPFLMMSFMLVVAVAFERLFTLTVAKGKGSINTLVKKIQGLLNADQIDAAISECNKQKGSVANIIRSGLEKYREVSGATDLDKDQKLAAIQKEVEEATSLELPSLERNLVILSTMSSIATLLGLLGTVFGMIRAFSAIATSGAPDAVALSSGISEALINTALGISTSAFSIILYNYFTTRIDKMTYAIDEAGFSIAQNFAAKHR